MKLSLYKAILKEENNQKKVETKRKIHKYKGYVKGDGIMKKIKLGFAPTRRSIFSAPDAIKYRGLTAQRLKELDVDFVDITDRRASV